MHAMDRGEGADLMPLVIAVSINGDIAAVAVGRLEAVRISTENWSSRGLLPACPCAGYTLQRNSSA